MPNTFQSFNSCNKLPTNSHKQQYNFEPYPLYIINLYSVGQKERAAVPDTRLIEYKCVKYLSTWPAKTFKDVIINGTNSAWHIVREHSRIFLLLIK